MMLYVIESGFLSTIQDNGRYGWARYGIPPSGPMDMPAFLAANNLVGNPPNSACLEITLTGPDLVTDQDCLIAVCGAEFALQVGMLSIPTWHAVFVRRGNHIRFGELRKGARAVLAISGGIDVQPFLTSRSTYLRGGFGGHEGRALQPGDELPVGQSLVKNLAMQAGRKWPDIQRPPYTTSPKIRVVLGPQTDYFNADMLSRFLQESYTITPNSDRMGIRLEGSAITSQKPAGFVSDGIVTGSIQIPPDGMPIIMMVDRQTTGGYPKIATVIQADIPILAQCLPGDKIQFEAISLDQACKIASAWCQHH